MALIYGLGGLLETRAVSFGVMRTRAGWFELRVMPQRTSYRGQLVVLIDGGTQSAGEIFASGLRDSGRAVVVGERSAGATLPSAVKELPTGAILQYAFADFVTASGELLEGRGVLPNLHVKLSRRAAGDATRAEGLTKASDATGAGVDPQVEPVIEKFVEAVGGRAAFERLS